MQRTLITRIGLFALAALLLAPAALAQGNQQQQPAPNVDVSANEIQTVAEVAVAINQIRARYIPKLKQAQQAKNKQQAMKLQRQYQQEVGKAIQEKEGISPKRFSTIMRAAQTDTTLQNKLKTAIGEVQSNNQDGNGQGG